MVGDAVAMIRENDNLEYVIPKEGTNLWFDNMVIPKNSKTRNWQNSLLTS